VKWGKCVLESGREVVRCLVTYNDWWQPSTGSILKVGAARVDKTIGDGLRAGLLETIEERFELCRRVALLSSKDRMLLFLWYVSQQHVDDIATQLRVSRRQCFRRRAQSIRKIVEAGSSEQAA
jgi:DNA-directed RNA polymerase specialized sigma subunit